MHSPRICLATAVLYFFLKAIKLNSSLMLSQDMKGAIYSKLVIMMKTEADKAIAIGSRNHSC